MPTKIDIYNKKCEKVSELELDENIFCVEKNDSLLHQASLAQMGNERQVLAHTKGRSDVRGGGKKPWRQKGTGRARAGTSRSPIWIGGGVTFGPTKDRNFSKDINKKMRRKAIFMVLSDKLENKKMVIVDDMTMEKFSTKEMDKFISSIEEKLLSEKEAKRSLILMDEKLNLKTKKSSTNLPGTKIMNCGNINILDLLKYRSLVLSEAALKSIQEKYKK